MHLHLPKPPENQRDLLKEVGVIVITILIALALEQMAKSRRWSRETGEAHAPQTVALDRNPSRLEQMSGQDACAEQRLVELEKQPNSPRTGPPLARNDNVKALPIFWTISTSVWEVVKTEPVGAHMSRADKLADASLTDNFKAYELNQTSQREACNNLASLYCVRHLDDKDIARGRGLIDTIRSTRKGNSRLLAFRADEIRTLGLTAEKIAPPDHARTAALCASAI